MKSIHILLVEDNEGDILLTTEALQEGRISNTISVVRDGEEAIDFLNQKGRHALAEQPDLVLLDVNLPKKNGHEVLQYIKKSDDIKHIPVIMLTTSSSEKDINLSYKNHANCYITKPVELDSFLNVVTQIENFWISIVTLPSVNKN
ncbi:response regulator [Dyadobacter subterraneus]|uniref:Response regulator n=1 Tax=Dyadobacter subterraneus TaxID=2773304 RepID=A0ABR9WFA0_9BACT|nr:response regulator [Dyadobacter subterraneus]MBE9464182.1 response regulator [Dyadobacter subterraneus]